MTGFLSWNLAKGIRRLLIALSVTYWVFAFGWAWSVYNATVAVEDINDLTNSEMLWVIHQYDPTFTTVSQPPGGKVNAASPAKARPRTAVDTLPSNSPHWARKAVRGVWAALRPITVCAVAYAAICVGLAGIAWVARGFRAVA